MAAAAQSQPPIDLSSANLEDLMNLKVTSVSKREQQLAQTAAAVFVITAEDIRRSGAANLPDVLRMAPGVDVQQIDANAWAISIRGFNQRYADKVLVLIDGRSVYTPTFSGVYWDQIDMPLENIERIEIIRGPGSTVWGANAVNGVINILTKNSKASKGGLLQAGAGTEMGQAVAQYGGEIGGSGDYRVFAKGMYTGNSPQIDGSPNYDHWGREQAGFRSDWDLSPRDSLIVEGSVFSNDGRRTQFEQLFSPVAVGVYGAAIDSSGEDILTRWDHQTRGGAETSVQASYTAYRHDDLGGPEVARTFDLDFQEHLTAGSGHDIVWGLGTRVSDSGLAPGYWIRMNPPFQIDTLFSAFLQDEIRLSDSLWLTLGTKLERNSFTGFEWEPGARLVWNPRGTRRAVWLAASKAIRQPSRLDAAVAFGTPPLPAGNSLLAAYQFSGNPRLKAETMFDYEAGYRSEVTRSLSLDIATFLSFYRNLESVDPGPATIIPGPSVTVIQTVQYQNHARALDYGGEISLDWKMSRRWRIQPGYSYLHATIWTAPGTGASPAASVTAMFPQNMLQVRSQVNFTRRLEFDQSLYYNMRLPGSSIPGDPRVDLRLARRFGESTEVSLVGQNLQRARSLEYGTTWGVLGACVARSIYGQITWRF